jgi:predicted metal-dependent phosphoesterase TrpH
MIDLHSHTTASDGSYSPTDLVHHARNVGLAALGIADHDTVDGLEEATAAAAESGLELVPCIEISVDYPKGEFHLLGYYVDYQNPDFLGRVRYLQDNRANRNAVMVRKMHDAGFDVTMEEIEAESGGGQVGRPHVARVLMRKGYVGSVQEAFDQYLADGKPLHVPKVKLAPDEAIELVHQAGGVAVVAHPKYMGYPTEEELAGELARLRDAGLDGLECYYSQHSEAETAQYLRLAERFGFVVTGGSDFHGVSKPDVPLGVVYQGRGADDALLAKLKAAAGRS